mmetsp:Transcript_17897/g.56027  ORF Transcript_17897/g.56027 Transcript_17897/m.56027 type:complete len:403 (+) Transcript_17897:512-1720(+)
MRWTTRLCRPGTAGHSSTPWVRGGGGAGALSGPRGGSPRRCYRPPRRACPRARTRPRGCHPPPLDLATATAPSTTTTRRSGRRRWLDRPSTCSRPAAPRPLASQGRRVPRRLPVHPRMGARPPIASYPGRAWGAAARLLATAASSSRTGTRCGGTLRRRGHAPRGVRSACVSASWKRRTRRGKLRVGSRVRRWAARPPFACLLWHARRAAQRETPKPSSPHRAPTVPLWTVETVEAAVARTPRARAVVRECLWARASAAADRGLLGGDRTSSRTPSTWRCVLRSLAKLRAQAWSAGQRTRRLPCLPGGLRRTLGPIMGCRPRSPLPSLLPITRGPWSEAALAAETSRVGTAMTRRRRRRRGCWTRERTGRPCAWHGAAARAPSAPRSSAPVPPPGVPRAKRP